MSCASASHSVQRESCHKRGAQLCLRWAHDALLGRDAAFALSMGLLAQSTKTSLSRLILRSAQHVDPHRCAASVRQWPAKDPLREQWPCMRGCNAFKPWYNRANSVDAQYIQRGVIPPFWYEPKGGLGSGRVHESEKIPVAARQMAETAV